MAAATLKKNKITLLQVFTLSTYTQNEAFCDAEQIMTCQGDRIDMYLRY
jgi:hypothetical protein